MFQMLSLSGRRLSQLSPQKLPILCFDSFYSSKAALDHLSEWGFRYVCALGMDKMPELQHKVRHDVTQPGNWAALWHEDEKLLYVLCWDRDKKNIGKKQVISNCYIHYPGYQQNKHISCF